MVGGGWVVGVLTELGWTSQLERSLQQQQYLSYHLPNLDHILELGFWINSNNNINKNIYIINNNKNNNKT